MTSASTQGALLVKSEELFEAFLIVACSFSFFVGKASKKHVVTREEAINIIDEAYRFVTTSIE